MTTLRLAACALLAAPIFSLAQPAPEAPPAVAPAATAADPFSQRGRALVDTVLRGGPDALAAARGTLKAGTPVDLAPGLVRGFVRVRVASGESGYAAAADVALEAGAPAAPAPAASAAPPPAFQPLAPPPPSPASRARLVARVGMALPADDYLDGFGNGLALEAGFTTALGPNLAAELTAGWSKLSAEESGVEIGFRSIPVLAGFRFTAPSPGLEAYVVVGAGFDFVSLTGSIPGTGVSVSDSATAPVFQLGAGMSIPLASGSRFELGVRYYAGQAELLDVTGGVDVTTIFAGWAL